MKNKRIKDKNKKQEGPIVIELNLSLTIGVIGAIIAIIVAITTVKVITTMFQANGSKNAANESDINQHAIYVTSTTKDESGKIVEDKDNEGNVIKVPVPKGYTASQIDGETSANKGFVIYEGDVDWSAILVNDKSTKPTETQSTANTESTNTKATTSSTEKSNSTQATNTASTEEEEVSDEITNDDKIIDSVIEDDMNSNTESTDNLEDEQSNNKTLSTQVTKSTENKKSETENQITETTKNEESNSVTESTQQNATSSTTFSTKSTKKEEIIEENNATTSTEEKTNDINVENTTEETVNTVEVEDDTTDDTSTTDSTKLTLEEQQNKNIFDLQKERNQYVWVPVDDPSQIYGVDANGKVWGKLYDFSSSGKSNRNWTETNGIMSITDKNNYREPDIVWGNGSYDTDQLLRTYGQTRYKMLTEELEQRYLEIVDSIKNNGGFYIGRYELGYENNMAVIKKMNNNNNKINWYKVYKGCLTLGENNNNIKTMMIPGSLWDETIDWLVNSGATNSEGIKLTYELVGRESKSFGNYYPVTFNYISQDAEMPIATETKEKNKSLLIASGSTEYTKTNNIYDMAGNVYEWTIEAYSNKDRGIRGGYYENGLVRGGTYPMAFRYNYNPVARYTDWDFPYAGYYGNGVRWTYYTLYKIKNGLIV